MSRNHKDKYENSNPRRMYTLMCPEDYQSGKKSHWSELEITGSIRNLSPNLWQMIHLTALYLNDNSLQRVPAEIGRLANLRILDLSSNKLRSLPAELGDLIYLRELLLNQNYLRVLPYELGKLFQLQVLGLQGNPLSKDVLTLYGTGEPSGTNKLLTYMLDNLQGKPPSFLPSTRFFFRNFRQAFFTLVLQSIYRRVRNSTIRQLFFSCKMQRWYNRYVYSLQMMAGFIEGVKD
ncbi:CCR4-NOT transcription complex subunit 6-like isoform X5 [Anoplolepis gracilipes]|uniref:CCR4-NOT transcription complex subunit 6-like isoform X5 n=1 Tax=Anoplolepis gracilipes TaxID=354296 RepID=UPI003BA14733